MRKMKALVQFLKFAAVGLSNNIVFYVIYVLMLAVGSGYVGANIVAFTISMVNSFYWNNKYVFVGGTVSRKKMFFRFLKTFCCYSVTGIFLSNLLLAFWIENLNIHEMAAPLINLVITVPLNYLLNKYWAFQGDQEEEKNES